MTIGKGCYFNFNCCLLDCAPISIGDNVLFGPNVQAPARHCQLLQYCMRAERRCFTCIANGYIMQAVCATRLICLADTPGASRHGARGI